MNEIIGNNIMTLRKEHGLTQEQLANALGISYQAVSKWETGNACPDISTLPLLADLFSVSVDALIGRVPLMSPAQQEPECETGPKENRTVKELPWPDDDGFYAVLYQGHRLHGYVSGESSLEAARRHFVVAWHGRAQDIISDFSVSVDGDVDGSVRAGGSVNCGDVEGSVDAGGSVNCGDVEGSVESGGNVNCGDVEGNVSAGNSVRCSDVEGSVTAGMKVECGEVSGSVTSAFTSSEASDEFSEKMERFGKNVASFGEALSRRINDAVNRAMNNDAVKRAMNEDLFQDDRDGKEEVICQTKCNS